MNRSICILALGGCLVSGCGQDPAANNTVVPPTALSKVVAWDASLIDGGEMFESHSDFRGYVRRSTLIAKGTLTRWDRDSMRGRVAVEDVLLGDPKTREADLVYDGGLVSAQVGDTVMVLLLDEDGSLKLNSRCGASGVTRWTDEIATVVRSALKPL